MNRKRTYLLVFAAIVVALAAVVIASVQSWVSVRKAFNELNQNDIPILEYASEVSLDISQARTEVFRYVNKYEPSPHRIRKHLKQVRSNLLSISQQQLPQNSMDLVEALLVHTGQFQKMLDLLESNMNKGDSINALLTANMLKGSGTTLLFSSGKLRDHLWDYIIYENEASQKRILRNNALLSGISLILIIILVCGVLFQNRILQRQVHARTVELEDRLNDLRQSERSLQESEAKSRELADLLPQTVFETDTEARLTYTNQFGFQTFGYTDEDIQLGLNAMDMLIPEQRNRAERRVRRIMAGENLPEEEYMAQRKNGTTFPVIIYSNHIQRSGEKLGLRGIIVDISERKRAESDRERLLSAIEQVAETIVITDAEGYIQYANPAFEQVSGYSRVEVIGKNLRILRSGKQDESFYRQMWQTITAGDTWRGWLINRKKDGTLYTEEASISPMLDGAGKVVNFVAVKRDITDDIRMEEQLRQAQKMESVGTLAGGIAHDFNNILFPIVGFAEMLKDDLPVDSPLQRHADEILHAALRAKDLVKQILTFSRQEDQDIKPIKLQMIVKEAMKLLRSSIPTTIDIQHDINTNCGVVVADSTQIHQIVMNLATNAYHAMEGTGGRLKVQLKQVLLESEQTRLSELVPGEYALLSVADTGIGIEEDVMDRIFDPYFTTKETGKGTGLGLSVVQGIVKNCNGEIRIRSEPGKGTEIQVYLPILDRKVDDQQTDRSKPIQGGTEKILLVDDEEPVVRMEQQMLERLGYRVTIRTGSVDALEAFKANPGSFDLVVTDMTMPNMTGVQLAGEIKKIRPDIPIILCTGFSHQVNDEQSKVFGIQGFVMKPVVMKEIAEIIRKVFDNLEEG